LSRAALAIWRVLRLRVVRRDGTHWWSGDMELVRHIFDDASVNIPQSAAELLPMITVSHLFVWEEGADALKRSGCSATCTCGVDFDVDASSPEDDKSGFFEEEHGLGAQFNADWECVRLSYSQGAS